MPEITPIELAFGGGINARRRIADVNLDECVEGSENFDLDAQHRAFRRRKPFDLITTAPNGGAINGFAQLIRQNGTVSTLVQAGGTVYSWNGDQTFTQVGTVNTGAKLRGPREQNFTLDEYVIVTDLTRMETVKKWDGTTFADLAHDLGGDLIAKYCRVHNERAFLGNVITSVTPGGPRTDTPHVILASEGGDGEIYSNVNRPTSSLGIEAAFFLPTPDLRPINGLEAAFGQFVISTSRGRLYRLLGANSFEYQIEEFHQGSAVVGNEAIKNIGNDVVLGLAGRIESLSGVINFGDVETNDLSIWISPLIDRVTSWTIEYDRRLQRVFCFPNNQSAVYVLHKNMLSDPAVQGLSPWSKWVTTHSIGFQPTTVMQLVDPITLQDRIYFGGPSGRIYRMDGAGDTDGGTDDITAVRRSRLFNVPDADSFDVRGWIHYRTQFKNTVTIRILGGGTAVYDQEVSRTLPTNPDVGVYGGPHYYGDKTTVYGGEFSGRIRTQEWRAAGHGSNLQVEVEVSGDSDFDIEGLDVIFTASKT